MDISFERLLMEPAREFFKKLIDFLPNMLSSLIIIITGLICAYIVKYLFIRFLRIIHFDKFCERVGVNQILQKGGIRNTPSHITGRIIYWLFVSIFIIIALNSLRVPSVEDLMTKFLLYLPNVFVAMIIIIFGYLIGNFLGRATLIASVNADLAFARHLGKAVKLVVFLMSVTMAMDQLGIGRATVIIAFGIILGGITLALAISFGLAGKDMAKDYLEKKLTKKTEEKQDDIQHM